MELYANSFFMTHNTRDCETDLIENFHPLALATLANSSDNPAWHEAMNGPQKDGYWRAIEIEINTVTNKDS